ncbi:MAG: response regulator transcription factor [Anaerolineaceae bacterium]|nr:response regulator transcription factor [Anaerolineaceae bacterium]
MEEQIRLVVADDHTIVRKGICGLISTEPGMLVVAEAQDGLEAVEKVRQLQPDVVLMDLEMPRLSGIEAIQKIKAEFPEARILVLTSFAIDDKVFPAIKAGALGYLLKDSSPNDLLQAIRDVYHGEPSLHPRVARKLMQEFHRTQDAQPDPLTERETEVLQLLAQGYSNLEIAGRLVVSERTVRTHVGNILQKLHLANRTQAALYALREGIARLGKNE